MNMHILFTTQMPVAVLDVALAGLPVTAALAAVALIGYLFGQRTRRSADIKLNEQRRSELDRAAGVARKLEAIADGLRQNLSFHRSRIDVFNRRLQDARRAGSDPSWERFCAEAESILAPTMQFAQQLAHAYDQIRQHTGALETFAQGRTDPLTGVGTGRALDQHLQVLLDARAKGNAEFVIALVGLDRCQETAATMTRGAVLPKLPQLAAIIRACMRDSDFVARLGDEEFVVVMPNTSLVGAGMFGERLLRRVADEMTTTLSCGFTEARERDDLKSLLGRADSAFYSAKAAGKNRIFVHTGGQIREHVTVDRAPRHEIKSSVASPSDAASPKNDKGDGGQRSLAPADARERAESDELAVVAE